MKRFTLAALATLFPLLLMGCSKEDPTPEARDPIFKDLEKRFAEHTKLSDEANAKLKELAEALEKVEPNSIEKKDIQRDIAKFRREALDHGQWARYYRIRTERRRITDRMTYKKAFVTGKEWPDPHEYSDYLVNRRLVEANRNWNTRVPKLQDRLPSSQPAGKKEGEHTKPAGH